MNAKIWMVAAALVLLNANVSLGQRSKDVPAGLDTEIRQFFADKQAQARALAKVEEKDQMEEIWEFFTAGENGDWPTVAQIYRQLRSGAYQYEGGKKDHRLETMVWQPVNEC